MRLLALCAEEELTVSELAEVLQDSQPQISRKAQPLRAAGLLSARKDGTRTYLKTAIEVDGKDAAIVLSGLEEGRRLCQRDHSLARLPKVLLAREDRSQRFFDDVAAAEPVASNSSLQFLPLLKPLLGARAEGLVVDVGAGDGVLLPLLSPLFQRVFAVDRSAARLSACATVIASHNLGNVRLLQGAVDDAFVAESCFHEGGAAVVVVARTLHHAARPAELLAACGRLLRDDGVVVVVDYLPHEDEAMREQGDIWLGFGEDVLVRHVREAGLSPITVGGSVLTAPMTAPQGHADSHLPWQWLAATRSSSTSTSSPMLH